MDLENKMAMIKACFVRKTSIALIENELRRSESSLYVPRRDHISASIELSLEVYSPEKYEAFINIQRSPTSISLSRVTSIDGTRRHGNRSRTYPANSTFTNAPMTCVQTLEFSSPSYTDTDQDMISSSIRAGVNTSSSGYLSKSDADSSVMRLATPTTESSSNQQTDDDICDCQMLGERPECIGQESSPDKSKSGSEIKRIVKAEDYQRSLFTRSGLCGLQLSSTKSKSGRKSISRNLKLFRKQFHQLGKAADCSLETLAIF